ncbi:MAG: YeaH/YhbH family protein [Clostridiaceae bacterium]|jgi:sporulation protein YhbH|nr:YeaH/YhbH family protein [Clostridiaceae bacterium]
MAIFREYESHGKERSAEDRRRHKELVEESIKENIGNIISEESIIGCSGNKKIRIPVKGIKEYSFIYGKNKRGVAQGDGDERRGDVVGDAQEGRNFGHGGAGDWDGDEIYETEITIEEFVNYLFDDLDLPDLDRRKLFNNQSSHAVRKLGYQKKGIPPRLACKRTVIEKIKRRQCFRRSEGLEGCKTIRHEAQEMTEAQKEIKSGLGRFPFSQEDMRFHRIRQAHGKDFNAVAICIMDVSGSMDQTRKYMARSFYFLLYQFLRHRYSYVEVVFIAHTTTAKEVSEVEFFHRGQSGGTYISSGYEMALEIIERRYNPMYWSIYAFHCSDGDNWAEDNKKAIAMAARLCEVCNLFGYGEIIPGYYFAGSTVKSEFIKHIHENNFIVVTISKKEDIVAALKRMLEKDGERE